MGTPTTTIQGKIAEIMQAADLERVAQDTVDEISGKIADHADLIALARCDEKGVGDDDSHDAHKIYAAAEAMILNAILRHMGIIVNQR